MAKGRRCQECGYYMYAEHEQYQDKGTWVTYVCTSGSCKEKHHGNAVKAKVFEGK